MSKTRSVEHLIALFGGLVFESDWKLRRILRRMAVKRDASFTDRKPAPRRRGQAAFAAAFATALATGGAPLMACR